MRICIDIDPSFPLSALRHLAKALAYAPSVENSAALRHRRKKLLACIAEIEARTGQTAAELRCLDDDIGLELNRRKSSAGRGSAI